MTVYLSKNKLTKFIKLNFELVADLFDLRRTDIKLSTQIIAVIIVIIVT